MSVRALVHENAQYVGDGYRLTVWTPDPFSADRPGELVITVDVQGETSMKRHVLGDGDLFTLPDGRAAKLLGIFVRPDGRSSAVAFELPDPAPDAGAQQ